MFAVIFNKSIILQVEYVFFINCTLFRVFKHLNDNARSNYKYAFHSDSQWITQE